MLKLAFESSLFGQEMFMSTTILVIGEYNFLHSSLCNWLKIVFPTGHIIDAADEAESIALAQNYSPQIVILDADFQRLETYLNTMMAQGLNASIFTARIVISIQKATSLPILYFQKVSPSLYPEMSPGPAFLPTRLLYQDFLS